MAQEKKTKSSFGTLSVAKLSPAPAEDARASVNMILSFEEALKLHFGLGQALAKLNTYSRSTTAGKNAGVNLCLYVHQKRITITEDTLATREKKPTQ